jgi:hypothetical protein
MRRYLALFDVSTIRLLLPDREFVVAEWLSFLDESGIPFAIRRDCQEFRVRAGIVGMKEISHGPTQGCSNP